MRDLDTKALRMFDSAYDFSEAGAGMIDVFEDHCWKDVVPHHILTLYEPYKRQLFVGAKPAILAIDLYDLVYQGGPRPIMEIAHDFPWSCGIYAWEAIEPTKLLLAAGRAAGIPIIYTTSDIRPNSKPTTVRATKRPLLEADLKFFEIREDFTPQLGDLVIRKQRASGFFGTPLASHLVQLKVDTVIVLGESTSGCVRASTVDGFSHGFHMVMAEECCFDRSELSHKINLFDLHHKYADVMKTAEIVSELNMRSGADRGA